LKTLALLLLLSWPVAGYSQDTIPAFDPHAWEAPYSLAVPKDWSVERFLIPISFAPEIPYKGIEDIRFAPGWGKAASENYWSYAFLWYLDDEVKMNSATLSKNLRLYYSGLIDANGPDIPEEKKILVETVFNETAKDSSDLKTFSGTIKMLDYMQVKPITLHCKVHLRTCPGENKTFLFYELSPRDFSHPVWLSLDNLWKDFKCKKE